MRQAIGPGGPALVVDEAGEPLGSAENPLVVSGAPAGDATIVDGGDVAQGATDDVAATAGGEGTVSAKLRLMTTQLDAIETTLGTIDASLAAILAILTDVHDAEGNAIRTTT